jgi:hypothetical protein
VLASHALRGSVHPTPVALALAPFPHGLRCVRGFALQLEVARQAA